MTAWLMTWLWQGSALAAGVALALRCTPGLNAATRHLVWCGALLGLAWLGWGSSPAPIAAAPAPVEPVFYVPTAPDMLISTIVGIWMSVALIGLVRLLPSLRAVFALRDRCVPFPVDIESRLPLWLEAKQKGRRTELMICDELAGATVLGLQRPCIALPRALVEALTIGELDQVILHEHAHVQRRDDWLRLVQLLLLSVMSVHPAALFVSRALNREREMACDEWVVARTGSPRAYARCLTRAAEVRARMKTQSALAPALFGTRHDLVRRVDRLLKLNGQARRNVSFAGALAAALALVMSSVHLQGLRFAEIADVVIPSVARPIMAVYDEATLALAELPVAAEIQSNTGGLSADTTTHTTDAGRSEANVPTALIARDVAAAGAFSAPVAPIAPFAPVAPIVRSVPFAGLYPVPTAPVASSADASVRWSALGTPGVEIAAAAKKTSLGVANVFSRAGVSLARSF
jgi:beta-lactamase regulating signal transducer with metallopeptidase domain